MGEGAARGAASFVFGWWRFVNRRPASESRPLQLRYFDDDGLAFASTALGEPGGEAFGETFGGEAVAGLNAAVGDGKSVVEIGGVGEIAHAELVEPIEGAGLFVTKNDDVDGELLRVHASILAGGRREVLRNVMSADFRAEGFSFGENQAAIPPLRGPARKDRALEKKRGHSGRNDNTGGVTGMAVPQMRASLARLAGLLRNLRGVGASHRLKIG